MSETVTEQVKAKKPTAKKEDDEIKELKKQLLLMQAQMENQIRIQNNQAPVPQDGSMQRMYSGQGTVDHDLFKLEVAKMTKDISWNAVPDYRFVEHCHFFHTVDSSGKKQKYSTATGGHFHEMKVSEKDGVPVVECVSGPLEWRWVKRGNKKFKKAVPVLEGKYLDFENENPSQPADIHVHDTSYVKSDKIELRRVNAEAVKLVTDNAQLTAKPRDLDVR